MNYIQFNNADTLEVEGLHLAVVIKQHLGFSLNTIQCCTNNCAMLKQNNVG